VNQKESEEIEQIVQKLKRMIEDGESEEHFYKLKKELSF
jgi:hypothetical protein